MSENPANMPAVTTGNGKHPIGWVEIPARDLAAAKDFYHTVFGWNPESFGSDYMVHVGGRWLGMGFLRTDADKDSKDALFYVSVSDIDDTIRQAASLGAEVVSPKQPIGPGMPNTAVVRNADGVLVGLMDGPLNPQPHIPAPWAVTEPVQTETICSIEIHGGKDLGAAQRFYGGLFGWGTASMAPQYMAFDPGAGIGGVFQAHTPKMPVMIYIFAADVHATLTRIESAGGKAIGKPAAMPGMGMFGYFSDINGVTLGLMGPIAE